jgi:glycosyltransferase involved in cell wall biosynthesis
MHALTIYSKFAPFHVARLRATVAEARRNGDHLTAVELAGLQADYGWAAIPQTPDFEWRCLFPEHDYWKLRSNELCRRLLAALDEIRPDVVMVPGWSSREAHATLAWCLRNGVPRVIVSDSQPEDRTQRALRLWVKRRLLGLCQAGFVGGTPHVRFLDRLGLPADRCFPGCTVADNEWFDREAGRRLVQPGANKTFRLLSCTRLVPEKNLLATLAAMARERRDWVWSIAGHGPLRAKIEESIVQLGLRDRVELLGHVAYENLPALYRAADLYLQPSVSETWGLAVNEAMACGLPVIVSDRCGCREDLVRDGENGFLFDPLDPKGLGQALARVREVRDRWPSMGQASRRIVAAWGLDLYARSFWQSCRAAREVPRSVRADRVAAYLVALAS